MNINIKGTITKKTLIKLLKDAESNGDAYATVRALIVLLENCED